MSILTHSSKISVLTCGTTNTTAAVPLKLGIARCMGMGVLVLFLEEGVAKTDDKVDEQQVCSAR